MAARVLGNRKVILLLILGHLAILNACHDNKIEVQHDATLLARLECESRELTHQKFILAQKYQNLNNQENIQQGSSKNGSSLRELDLQKASLIKLSQKKSDSVNNLLKYLWKTKYQTKEEMNLLDEVTKSELKKMCSLSAP